MHIEVTRDATFRSNVEEFVGELREEDEEIDKRSNGKRKLEGGEGITTVKAKAEATEVSHSPSSFTYSFLLP